MLKIFNDLEPFFKDNYVRINIREYARIRRISPPTASNLLRRLEKEGLLKRENEKNYIYYVASKESKLFIELSRIYWSMALEKVGIIAYLEKELISPVVILFGSLSKAEAKIDSDVDLAIFTISTKKLVFNIFEKKLGRRIQFYVFKSREDIKNKALQNNILNGFTIAGGW